MTLNKTNKIYLASGSPRRHDLMTAAEIEFEHLKIEVEEIYPDTLDIYEIAPYLARLKADAALKEIDEGIVVTADTVVLQDGIVLGKPANRAEAFQTIKTLSDRSHEVVTGVCLTSSAKQICFSSLTTVELHSLTDEEIDHYIDRYKPFDKAGSYGIQEWFGWVKIKRIEGSYANVMGLPIDEVYKRLNSF